MMPLYDKVGIWGIFFESISEFENYSEDIDLKNKEIFINVDDLYVNHITLNGKFKDEIDIIEKYLCPPLPFWIKSNNNFNKILERDYYNILPQTAEIITTMNCCFRCQQCSYRPAKEEMNIWNKSYFDFSNKFHMSPNTIIEIIDKLDDIGTRNVVFTGGGEPLINSETTISGMRLAKAKNMSVGLYTNGFNLNDKIIKELEKINPLFIRISIYGVDPMNFSKYTNANEEIFIQIINNIKKLINSKKMGNIQTKISLSFLVHPVLYPNTLNIGNFFDSLFTIEELRLISTIRFTPAVDYYENRQHDKNFFEKIFEQIESLKKRYYDVVQVVPYIHRTIDIYNSKPYMECRGSGYYAEIAPNGDMYLCCEKLMNDNFLIGNILNNSIEEIFNSQARLNLIEQVNSDRCEFCPSLCKPHEINKQLANVDYFNMEQLKNWRNNLLECATNISFFPGRLNDFES